MARRTLQRVSMRPVDVLTPVAPEALPTIHLDIPVSHTSGVTVRAPRRAEPAMIQELRVYLGVRDIGDLLNLPGPERFPVASADQTRPDVALPFGAPRLVRAGMLKLLAG